MYIHIKKQNMTGHGWCTPLVQEVEAGSWVYIVSAKPTGVTGRPSFKKLKPKTQTQKNKVKRDRVRHLTLTSGCYAWVVFSTCTYKHRHTHIHNLGFLLHWKNRDVDHILSILCLEKNNPETHFHDFKSWRISYLFLVGFF